MITFKTKQVKGSGMGTSVGFPTINIELDALPTGMDIGLYLIKTVTAYWSSGQGILNLSRTKTGKIRGEYHVMMGCHEYGTDKPITFTVLMKLRDYININTKNREKVIEDDKILYQEAIISSHTCKGCKYFMAQDYGYSNYTVEGTDYICLKNKFESEDNEDIAYNGISCESFDSGEPWYLDVDGECPGPSNEWLKEHNCIQ